MRLSSLFSALLLVPAAAAQTVHVDADLTTGAGDGTSWADAYQGTDGLQAALNASAPGQTIFVAEGVYRTSASGSRSASFLLRTGVEVYGGFVGAESSPDERPAFGAAPSVLTADLNGDDAPNFGNRGDNGFHVVRTQSTNATAVLDGFEIRGGNANGANPSDRGGGILCLSGVRPTIRRCRFVDNRCSFGGGAGYINGAAPTFTECVFEANFGGAFGGAFDIASGGPVAFDRCSFLENRASRAGALEVFATSSIEVANSVFIGNVATGGSGGGALWIGSGGSTRVRGCTIVGNRASSQAAGGIRVQGASPSIVNTILWDNEGPGGAQGSANQITPGSNVQYSIVEGGIAGTGNLSADPAFVDAASGDLRLALPSPAIDAGNNAAVPTGLIADRDGRRRRVDEPTIPDTGAGGAPIVDIGAYERTDFIGQVDCVAANNSIGARGRIDASGSLDVASNDVTLIASDLPQSAFGFFLASRTRGFVANPGGSAGNLCLSGAIGRYVGPGQVQNTGATGSFELVIDLASIPQPNGAVAALPGESWSFQAWHRDSVIGIPTSNFTDGVRLTLQ
ncbi:MAG: right-handed parallel beta-helix repeat-containing protein [Planctomycetota bacterium]